MMRLQVTENYTVNSKGESVPIHEVAWGNEDDVPYTYIYTVYVQPWRSLYQVRGNIMGDNVKLVY